MDTLIAKKVLLEAREALQLAHSNWSDVYHDVMSTCKICRAIGAIDDLIAKEREEVNGRSNGEGQ